MLTLWVEVGQGCRAGASGSRGSRPLRATALPPRRRSSSSPAGDAATGRRSSRMALSTGFAESRCPPARREGCRPALRPRPPPNANVGWPNARVLTRATRSGDRRSRRARTYEGVPCRFPRRIQRMTFMNELRAVLASEGGGRPGSDRPQGAVRARRGRGAPRFDARPVGGGAGEHHHGAVHRPCRKAFHSVCSLAAPATRRLAVELVPEHRDARARGIRHG